MKQNRTEARRGMLTWNGFACSPYITMKGNK